MEFEPAQTVWETRRVSWHQQQENDLSKKVYGMLLKWMKYANEQYGEWDGRPECGHFFGGNYWYVSDSVSTALVFAIAAKLGDYDEAITGIPRHEVKRKAINTIRYIGFTHDEGPADCVRVKGELPYTSEKKWGGKQEQYFMATQNGRSVAAMAHAALLLWDDFDDETKLLVQNVVASYADRWCDIEPKNGSYYDTQCEENSWTSAGISAALVMFPEHPHAEAWKQGAMNWSFNAVTRTQDRMRFPSGLIDLSEGTSAKTVTFHPDFTSENHAFVHPAYMGAGINLRFLHHTMSLMVGMEALPTFSHNNNEMYQRTLKKWVQADGLVVPVQGQDWWYNRHHDNHLTHAIMSVTENDSDASRLERNALQIIEDLQASNSRGCLLEENGETYVFNKAHGQYANQLEHGSATDLAYSYLLHLFGGEGAQPSDQNEMMTRLSGVAQYPYGGIIIHRTPETLSSFSWHNNVMALSQPQKGMWNVTPLFHSFTGTVDFKEKKAEKVLAHETLIHETEKHNIQPQTDGFSATALIERGDKELHQDISFMSLPNGHAIYIERFSAPRNCSLNYLHTGYIGIRNEQYERMPELAPGERTLHVDGAKETFKGFYGKEPNRVKDFTPSEKSWVNVDDEIGYLTHGSAGIRYINRHQYERWKGVEDLLILNCREQTEMGKDESLEPFVLVSMPNQSHHQTEEAAANLRILKTNVADTTVLLHQDYLAYANFSPEKELIKAQSDEMDLQRIPLFKGTVELKNNQYHWSSRAEAYSSGYIQCSHVLEIKGEQGEMSANNSLKINVMDDQIALLNTSPHTLELMLKKSDGSQGEAISIATGTYYLVELEM